MKVRAIAFAVGSPGTLVRFAPLPEKDAAVSVPETVTFPEALKVPAAMVPVEELYSRSPVNPLEIVTP